MLIIPESVSLKEVDVVNISLWELMEGQINESFVMYSHVGYITITTGKMSLHCDFFIIAFIFEVAKIKNENIKFVQKYSLSLQVIL